MRDYVSVNHTPFNSHGHFNKTPNSASALQFSGSEPPTLADHFANEASTSNSDSLPEHIQASQLPAPRYNISTVFAQLNQISATSKFEQLKSLASLLLQLRQIEQEAKKAEAYLPDTIKKRVAAYNRFGYYKDLLLHSWKQPGLAQRTAINLQGPLAIKAKQADVMNKTLLYNSLQQLLQEIQEEQKAEKTTPQKTTTQPKTLKEKIEDTLANIVLWALPWGLRILQYDLNIYKPLLDAAPSLPKAFFDKPLKQLQNDYNQQFPKDPITQIGDCIGTGSIGQVFLGHTQNGKKLALKVLRPDASPDTLKQYDRYLTYKEMILSGEAGRHIAYQKAKATIQLLLNESNLAQEKQSAEHLGQWFQKHQFSNLGVPSIWIGTDQGFIQDYAGQKSLNRLQGANFAYQKQKLTQQLTPELITLYALSPHKYLDYHAGNLMLSDKNDDSKPTAQANLIDYGRLIEFNPKQHQALMALTLELFSAANVNKAFRNITAEHPSIQTLTAKGKNPQETLDLLRKELFNKQPVHEAQELLKQAQADLRKQQSNDTDSSSDEQDPDITPSFSHLWLNYSALQARPNSPLAALSKDALSADDRLNISQKLQGLVEPYFRNNWPSDSNEHLAEKTALEQLTLEQDRQLSIDLKLSGERFSGNLISTWNAPDTNQLEAFHHKKLKETLKDPEKQRDLQQRYHYRLQKQQLAQQLAKSLCKEAGQTFDSLKPTVQENLMLHISHCLDYDFPEPETMFEF